MYQNHFVFSTDQVRHWLAHRWEAFPLVQIYICKYSMDANWVGLRLSYTCLWIKRYMYLPCVLLFEYLYAWCYGLTARLFIFSVVNLKQGCLFVVCLTSQQQACVSQGRICSDNFTCCHIEIEVADQTFYLTQSQYTDTGPTSPSADPIMPGTWQGSHWSANFEVTGMTRPRKNLVQAGFEPGTFRSGGGRLNH